MTTDVAIRIQKWAIGALVTMVLGLIGWVYSYGQFTLKVDQVESAVQELRDDLYTMDARITELLITRMDSRFRREDWEREEAKIDTKFNNQQDEINRLHKEINRVIDKIETYLDEQRKRVSP